METFYCLPMAFGSDTVPALIHLGAAIFWIAGVVSVAGVGPAGWAAALLLCGQPALLRLAGSAHSDAATALFVFAAAGALSLWEDGR